MGYVERIGRGDVRRLFGWGNLKGGRPFGRSRRRWEDNIKMDLQVVGWETWTGLIWLKEGRVLDCCKCGNEPSGFIKYGEFLE